MILLLILAIILGNPIALILILSAMDDFSRADEIEYMEKYASIINHRFMGKITIETIAADEVLDKDPDQVRISKRILAKLPQVDRTLFILYADCQSYRKLGKALGLSHMTARKEILRIRQTILEEYAKETRK